MGLTVAKRIPSRAVVFFGLAGVLVIVGACTGGALESERRARGDLEEVAGRFRPSGVKPDLLTLAPDSPIDDYLRFALLNSPRVEAAYFDWAASVERITDARSLPDPRLTFELDIAEVVMSAKAGLMMDLPGPGKLRAAGNLAAAESTALYAVFEGEVLRAAYALKSAWYRALFLEDNLRAQRENLLLLSDLEQLARQQNAAGRASLQDVLRAQIEQEQLRTRIANLEDSRSTLVAELKAALGLGVREADPPLPARFVPSPGLPARDAILEIALRRNPGIRRMAADVRRAEAQVELARTAGVPDFAAGIEADFKDNPATWKPSIGMTLPVWRDKIAARIAAAQGEKRAAEARLTAEQVQFAAELTATLYAWRESLRNVELLEERLLPRARQSFDAARTGYANGRSGFLDVVDAYRQVLAFDVALIEARTRRELALASLSLLIAGVPPPGAPVLAPESNPDPPKEFAR